MPSERAKFQADLLAPVKQMRRGQAARVTKVKLPQAAEAQASVGLLPTEFALLLGVFARTLQDWEQGRREPAGAAKTLLRVRWPILKSSALCTRTMRDQVAGRTCMPSLLPPPC